MHFKGSHPHPLQSKEGFPVVIKAEIQDGLIDMKPEIHVSIPCPICGMGETGTHNHYGGRACTSCRAFFRRSVQTNSYKVIVNICLLSTRISSLLFGLFQGRRRVLLEHLLQEIHEVKDFLPSFLSEGYKDRQMVSWKRGEKRLPPKKN